MSGIKVSAGDALWDRYTGIVLPILANKNTGLPSSTWILDKQQTTTLNVYVPWHSPYCLCEILIKPASCILSGH